MKLQFTQRQKDTLVLLTAIVLGIVVFIFYDSLQINDVLNLIKNIDNRYILLVGMFFSFIGNAGVLASIPYAPVVAFLSISISDPLLLVFFGFLCGIAAGGGETVCYGIGIFLRKKLKTSSIKKFERLTGKLGRSKAFLVFLAGISPIPDEFIIIPLASGRYSFRKTFFFDTAGKCILGVLIAFAGSNYVNKVMNSPLPFSLSAFFFLITYYLFIRLDWEKLFFHRKQEDKVSTNVE